MATKRKPDKPARAPRVTLRHLADHLGLSTATVSLAMRNKPRVAEETKKRVLEGMRELGYIYNRGAASLRSDRSGTVGVAISDIADPYFAQLLISIQAEFNARGLMVFLCHSVESTKLQDDFIDTLREYSADGLILCPAAGTRVASLRRVLEWHMPVVLVTRSLPDPAFSFVGAADEHGMQMATDHLISLGHRRIAFFGGDEATSTGRERRAGYSRSLSKNGIPVDPSLIISCPTNRRGGIAALSQALAMGEPPTAAVCAADIIAFGVMLELTRRGLRPGRDFAVVGYDDVIEAALWQPPLTTVAVPRQAMGIAAARLLAELIEVGPAAPPRRIIFEPTLMVRASCGSPLRKLPITPAPQEAVPITS
jgi:LacI family transcriptional regulator